MKDDRSNGGHIETTGMTPEEYLVRERAAQYKSEYVGGTVRAMSGASWRHNLLVSNLAFELHIKLRDGDCQAVTSDMRVHIEAVGDYFYPDVVVVCGKPDLLDNRQDTLLNPVVIIEVSSDATEAFDRGKKFETYRLCDSLMEYAVVSQKEHRVEVFRRSSQWTPAVYDAPEDVVRFESIGVEVSIEEIYRRVFESGM